MPTLRNLKCVAKERVTDPVSTNVSNVTLTVVYTPSKESRTKDPDCIPSFPGSKDKPVPSESPGKLVNSTDLLHEIYCLTISGVGALSNFCIKPGLGTTMSSHSF